MSVHDDLIAAIESRAGRAGISFATAAEQVMLLVVRELPALPATLSGGLQEAQRKWIDGDPAALPLEPFRAAAWDFLEARNGSSVMTQDEVDATARALICTLWDDPSEYGSVEDNLAFFADMVSMCSTSQRAIAAALQS